MKLDGAGVASGQNTINQPGRQPEVVRKVEVKRPVEQQPMRKAEVDISVEDRAKDFPEYIPSIAEKTLMNAISVANKKLQGLNTEFQFSVHEATKEIMVKVLNKDTGEVIREIPSEKVLDMVAKMWELSGIFVDERR